MIVKKFIIVLLLSCVLFACSSKHDPHAFVNFGNIPIIEMVLDVDTVHMIIDTGAEFSIINSDYYNTHSRNFRMVNQLETVLTGVGGSRSQFSNVIWTGTSFGNITFVEYDISEVIKKFPDYNIAGLLGSDFLRQHNYVVDYKIRRIYPYEIRDSIYAEINSKHR